MSASKILNLVKPLFVLRHASSMKPYTPAQALPDNIQGLNDSQKTQSQVDRSREASGQQTTQMFSSAFMSNQGQMEELADSGIDQSVRADNSCYDLDGNAHLESVLQTNVPEPYKPENVADLKEGVPEGLSDCVKSQGQRWSMDDRIDHSYEIQKS